MAQQSKESAVGVVSSVIAVYCFLLFMMQVFIARSDASKFILAFSYTSILCMSLASAFVAATYYFPHFGSGSCYCHPFWSASLVFYVISLYLIKQMYVQRTRILNKGDVFATKATKMGVHIVTASNVCTSITCFILVTARAGGECYSDPSFKGCLATFDLSVLYVAIAMISLDATLFSMFCYTWFKLLSIFKVTEKDNKIPADVLRSFGLQFTFTVTAMASCVFDSVYHLIYYEDDGSAYHNTMIIYCVDMAIIATCNGLMISETRTLLSRVWEATLGKCIRCDKKVPKLTQKKSLGSKSSHQTTEMSANTSMNASVPTGSTQLTSIPTASHDAEAQHRTIDDASHNGVECTTTAQDEDQLPSSVNVVVDGAPKKTM